MEIVAEAIPEGGADEVPGSPGTGPLMLKTPGGAPAELETLDAGPARETETVTDTGCALGGALLVPLGPAAPPGRDVVAAAGIATEVDETSPGAGTEELEADGIKVEETGIGAGSGDDIELEATGSAPGGADDVVTLC